MITCRKLTVEFVLQPPGSESDDDRGGHSRSRKRRHRASRSPSNTSRAGSVDSSDSQYSSARRTRHKKTKRKKARSRSVSTRHLGKDRQSVYFQMRALYTCYGNFVMNCIGSHSE